MNDINQKLKIESDRRFRTINRFINIIKDHAQYKIKIFTYKPYIYSIISLYNPDIPEANNIIDFNQF